ncbi:methyltransferase [Streptomyces sp. NPDC001108]
MSTARQSAARLIDESLAFLFPAALRAAAAVGVADHLADGDESVERLAAATGTDARNPGRVLRLLATRGVVEETDEGRFRLTTTGRALRSDAPHSARAALLMPTDPSMWRPAGEMTRCLTDRGPALTGIFGTPFFDHFARDAETAAVLHVSMTAMPDPENRPVATAHDFPSHGTVIDVGGGHGGLLTEVLRRRPGLRQILHDREHDLAGHRLGHPDTTGRWSLPHGDFFPSVPAGDLYLLKRILHDWDDDSATILHNCRRSMTPGGRVLVIDAVVPPGNLPHQSKTMDLMTTASLTGKERTAKDFARLFTAAGLRLRRIVPTPTVLSALEAASTT